MVFQYVWGYVYNKLFLSICVYFVIGVCLIFEGVRWLDNYKILSTIMRCVTDCYMFISYMLDMR
jgi:hypothetical protein